MKFMTTVSNAIIFLRTINTSLCSMSNFEQVSNFKIGSPENFISSKLLASPNDPNYQMKICLNIVYWKIRENCSEEKSVNWFFISFKLIFCRLSEKPIKFKNKITNQNWQLFKIKIIILKILIRTYSLITKIIEAYIFLLIGRDDK